MACKNNCNKWLKEITQYSDGFRTSDILAVSLPKHWDESSVPLPVSLTRPVWEVALLAQQRVLRARGTAPSMV